LRSAELFRLFFDFRAWVVIRFAYSLSLGTLFVLSEFWIASIAPADRRGYVIGIYATVLALGFAVGPTLLALVGTSGWPPYLAGAALLALAAVPPFLARHRVPTIEAAPRHALARYILAVPLASAAGIASGAVETGGFSLLPVYGIGLGYEAATAALLVSAIAFGNVISQIPLGLIADRLSKARVLAVIALLGIAGSLALPCAAAAGTVPLFALLVAWGGVYGGLYTVGLAHLADRYQAADLAGGNAAFVVLFNAGLLLGPPVVGAGFDWSATHGLPLAMGLFFALVGAAWLLTRDSRMP
jgi:MFS family permease